MDKEIHRTVPLPPLARGLGAPVAAAIAMKIALLFVLAWNSRFVMDEFQQFGQAKYFSNGMFETFWPAKAVGYALFYELSHVIFGKDAVAMLLAGRMQTALLACATLALVYAIARTLGQDKLRALLVVLILLGFSTFMERIFRTRADPLSVFFAGAALLTALRAKGEGAGALVIAGILSGLSFLATQKAVYFNLALGLALIGDAALQGQFRVLFKRGALLVAGWLIPILLYCLILGGSDAIAIARSVFLGPAEIATRGDSDYGSLRYFVTRTLVRNVILYAFCFAGMAIALGQLMRAGSRTRMALIFTLVITVLVFTHDQPWPYVFIMALPFMALWALRFEEVLAGRSFLRVLAWTLLGLAIALSYATNLRYLRIDNGTQLALVARAEASLAPGERYFDGIGIVPNRLESPHRWLDKRGVNLTLERGEQSVVVRQFRQSPPVMIIWNSRTEEIAPVIDPLLRHSYVRIGPYAMVPGQILLTDRTTKFDVPTSGDYVLYRGDGQPLEAEIAIGGTARETPVRLSRGELEISWKGSPSTVVLARRGIDPGLFGPEREQGALFEGVYD